MWCCVFTFKCCGSGHFFSVFYRIYMVAFCVLFSYSSLYVHCLLCFYLCTTPCSEVRHDTHNYTKGCDIILIKFNSPILLSVPFSSRLHSGAISRRLLPSVRQLFCGWSYVCWRRNLDFPWWQLCHVPVYTWCDHLPANHVRSCMSGDEQWSGPVLSCLYRL